MARLVVILMVLFMASTVYGEAWPGGKSLDYIANSTWNEGGGSTKVSNDVLTEARDGITNAIQTITYAHHEAHSGSHYFIKSYDVLGSAEDLGISFVTPAGDKKTHIILAFSANQPITAAIYEDVTLTDSTGTAIVPINSNRDSSNVTGNLISRDATVTAHGTTLERLKLGLAGVNPAQTGQGGATSRETELILDDDSKYLFVITSDAATNSISYSLEWYEHTDKR